MRFSPWSRHSALEVSVLITFLFPLYSCSYGTPATGYSSGLSLGRRATVKDVMCSWLRPQSTLFRDTIFIDGGTFTWQTTGDDGKTTTSSNPRQRLYYLNLTSAFSLADDGTTAIQSTPKLDGNVGINFKDGFMLANDYEFIVYGGFMDYVNKDSLIGPTWSQARDMVQHGEVPLRDAPKYRTFALDGVTRYIAAGGSVSVPSENKAYVFSGETGKGWGEFFETLGGPTDAVASWNSSQLISVDMSTMGSEKWDNRTFPSSIPARKSAELVWLPIGSLGTLVVIGGALNHELMGYSDNVTDEQRTMGKYFVDNVHLYDIANDKWYTQQTSGDNPPAKSEFCTSYAASQDGKSFQIYAYGGWEDFGSFTNPNPPSANVYVLSLPAFKWIKVYDDEDATHGRRGHRCHKVADNLMMVVGGALPSTGNCINGGMVKMFNMNTLKWESKYDPAVHDVYKVPDVVYKVIGGTEKGGANVTPSSWNSTEIQALFGIKYTKTVKNYWPYPSVSGTVTTSPTVSGTVVSVPSKSSGGGGVPSYLPPLLGAILGLLVLITILCAVLFCLRRKRAQQKRLQSDSAASTVRKNRQTWSWLLGVYGDEKRGHGLVDPTPSTEPPNPFDASAVTSPMTEETDPIETAGRPLYEMPDNSVARELCSGLVPQRRVTISEQVMEIHEDPQNKRSTTNE